MPIPVAPQNRAMNADANHARRVVEMHLRGFARSKPANNAAQLIHTRYCGRRVVYRRRYRLQCNIDNLQRPEFDVLLQCSHGPDIESCQKGRADLGRQAFLPGHENQRDASGNELPYTLEDCDLDLVTLDRKSTRLNSS